MNTVVDKNNLNNTIEVVDTTRLQVVFENVSNEELIEAISDLIDLHLACIRLNCLSEENLIERIWYLTSKWIEIIGSVKYIPGLIEELSRNIVRKLWNSDIDHELLNELFLKTYLMRRNINSPRETISEYRELVSEFLIKLGYSGEGELINKIIESNDPEDLITLFVLTIVISTSVDNPYPH